MNDAGSTRRQLIRSGASMLALATAGRAFAGQAPARGELRFRLEETAGLRRFGYPVSAILPGVNMGNHFQLLRGGQPVSAQFRATDGPDGGPAVVLDFNSSLGPLASETYVVRYGSDLAPGPEPRASLHVEHGDGVYRVVHGPGLRFEVPEDLRGFLRFAGSDRRAYVAEGARGLWLRSGGNLRPLTWAKGEGNDKSSVRARVVREGPLAAALQFDGNAALPGDRTVTWRAVLTFPSSKSWVEALLTVDDPEGAVGGLGLDLNLALAGSPTLVDLGANSTVYATLKENERVDLRAGRAPGEAELDALWVVRKGAAEKLEPFAIATSGEGGAPVPAEGWAHAMDNTRATALAVDRFGRDTLDAIEVDGRGRVRIERAFAGGNAAPPKGTKSLRFWFHFVTMPVQVGAATSPQAMLAPLKVVWLEEGKT